MRRKREEHSQGSAKELLTALALTPFSDITAFTVGHPPRRECSLNACEDFDRRSSVKTSRHDRVAD